MSPRPPILLSALLVALGAGGLAASCGDGPSSPAGIDASPAAVDAATPDAIEASLTVEGLCGAISDRICAGLSSCGCRFDLRPYDAAGCAAARTSQCVATFGARVGPDLAAGHARLDPPSVTRCLAAVEAMAGACTLADSLLPHDCDTNIMDVADVGAACSVQGGGQAFCAGGAGVCTPGDLGATCTRLPGVDQPCDGLCARGLACASTGVCAPPGAVNAPCAVAGDCAAALVCAPDGHCASPLDDGMACTDYQQCQAGHGCPAGVCAPAVALDGGCASQDECGAIRACGRAPETRTCGDADGLGDVCRDGTCAAGLGCATTCVALPGVGQPCLDNSACAAGLTCADGLHECQRLPGVGQPCAVGNRFCADGLGCDQASNTCQPPPGNGQPCVLNPPDYLCGAGLGCDFGADGSVCIPKGGVGSACTNDRTCGPGTYCEYSTGFCAARLADGSTCNDGNECLPGSECTPGVTSVTCQPHPVRGAPCTDACADQLTCKGPGGTCVPGFCVIP